MGRFIIKGNGELSGEVRVSGSKNAALPIIFASLITHGVSEIHNLPDISDVNCALGIIADFGARITRLSDSVYIDTAELEFRTPREEAVARLRASTYLIGAGLARFGRAELQSFGGCNFSKRPIDMHISSAVKFGAREWGCTLLCDELLPVDIHLEKKSVGATVNTLIMAAAAKGTSRISGYAEEPHILSLIGYLRSAGAMIDIADGVITVRGGELRGGRISIPGDMIEAGTFLTASILTEGEVRVFGLDPSELSSFLAPLLDSGVRAFTDNNGITLFGEPRKRMDIVTAAYPGFPTDLQPIFSVIMARFCGGSIIETVWPGRFGYLSQLAKLGVSYVIDERGARIYQSHLECGTASATDLRGGAAAILASLTAKGKSTVLFGETVLRGYENLAEKFRSLGADIIYKEDC